jgi:cell division inhibitor SulA
MVVCSFALHLVPESEMFPLCWELSTKVRWLVVIAPHKKPEVSAVLGVATHVMEKWGRNRTR